MIKKLLHARLFAFALLCLGLSALVGCGKKCSTCAKDNTREVHELMSGSQDKEDRGFY